VKQRQLNHLVLVVAGGGNLQYDTTKAFKLGKGSSGNKRAICRIGIR
jgi:hypothetical protein